MVNPIAFLTNVPTGTAVSLSYAMLLVVAIFLISGPIITYLYRRKYRREKAVSPAEAPHEPASSS